MIDPQLTEQTTTAGLRILELSAGGIFAVILIDKVLGWTVKLKGRNGNGKNIPRVPCLEHRPWIQHDLKQDNIDKNLEKLCEALPAQAAALDKLVALGGEQIMALRAIERKLPTNGD
jgi:hypothetical protein